jgi:spore germination cell wall hydrolase CwlJ-like protein
VARATLNRVASKLYPDTICGVVYQYRQFSWTLEPKQIGDYKAYQLALQAAKAAYNYNSPVTHFHKSNINPKWASNLTRDIQVNNHVFYY